MVLLPVLSVRSAAAAAVCNQIDPISASGTESERSWRESRRTERRGEETVERGRGKKVWTIREGRSDKEEKVVSGG